MPSPSISSPSENRGRAWARVPAPRRVAEARPTTRATAVFLVVLPTVMLGAGLGAERACASIMLALELPDLVQKADHIAVVDVKSVRSDWDAKHERIYSTIELGVVDLWKTTAPATGPSTLTIVQPGGTVGDISMVVMGMSRFVPGTRSLVFLRGQPNRAEVVGMSQGLHPLTFESTTKRWTVAPPALANVKLIPRANAPVRPPAPASTAMIPTTPFSRAEGSTGALASPATTVSRLSPLAPVALEVMKAEVLRLMSAAP